MLKAHGNIVQVFFAIAAVALPASLPSQVEAIAARHHGHVTLFAEDLKTGRTVAINPDEAVATASVIKLAILYETLQQIRSGKASWSDRLSLPKDDQVGGSGILQFFDTPLSLTLKDAVTFMIIMSDNTATNLVIDKLGLENINQRIRSIPLPNTVLYKKVFRPASGEPTPDQKKFGLGKTTARDMATLMTRFYHCDLGPPATARDLPLCTAALTMLRNQFYRDSIPRYIDEKIAPGTGDGVAVGNKSGALNQVRNDVALIAGKRGPIVLSVFTYDNQDQSWQADNEAELTIAKIAKAIVNEWSPEGLAPDTYKPNLQLPEDLTAKQ